MASKQKNIQKETINKLKNKIEIIHSFEEKMGIKYDNISFIIEKTYNNDSVLYILGNIVEVDESKYSDKYSIDTIVTIYDNDNDIIATNDDSIDVSSFLGFCTFKINIGKNFDFDNISKILIYPQ